MIIHFHIQHHAGTNLLDIVKRNHLETKADSAWGHETQVATVQYQHPIIGPPGLPWIKPDPQLSADELEQRWLALGLEWAQIEMPFNRVDNTPWDSSKIVFTIIMRHPMDRILANTTYPRKGFPEILEKGDYSRWVNREGGDYVDNMALRWIAGKSSREGPVNEQDYLEAKKRLEKFNLIIIQEWLPEAGQLLHDVLGWQDYDFGPKRVRKPARERINIDALYDELVERLHYDIKLYEHAIKLAEERWGKPS